jgi:hypothetical protein
MRPTHAPRPDSPQALANVLALLVALHPEDDPREARMLHDLDAYRRIGLAEPGFRRAVARLRRSGDRLITHGYADSGDLELIDELLDAVRDDLHRLLLCRMASCLITVDGRISDLERSIYDRMLLRWGYTRASVSRAILARHVH